MREAERLKRIRDQRMNSFDLQVESGGLIEEVSIDGIIEGSEENDVINEQDPEITIEDDSEDLNSSLVRKRKSESAKSFIPYKKVNPHLDEDEIVCISD
jgi:hypothetical protein